MKDGWVCVHMLLLSDVQADKHTLPCETHGMLCWWCFWNDHQRSASNWPCAILSL